MFSNAINQVREMYVVVCQSLIEFFGATILINVLLSMLSKIKSSNLVIIQQTIG